MDKFEKFHKHFLKKKIDKILTRDFLEISQEIRLETNSVIPSETLYWFAPKIVEQFAEKIQLLRENSPEVYFGILPKIPSGVLQKLH